MMNGTRSKFSLGAVETDQMYQQEVANFYMLHNDKKTKNALTFLSLPLCGLKLKASSNYSHTWQCLLCRIVAMQTWLRTSFHPARALKTPLHEPCHTGTRRSRPRSNREKGCSSLPMETVWGGLWSTLKVAVIFGYTWWCSELWLIHENYNPDFWFSWWCRAAIIYTFLIVWSEYAVLFCYLMPRSCSGFRVISTWSRGHTTQRASVWLFLAYLEHIWMQT